MNNIKILLILIGITAINMAFRSYLKRNEFLKKGVVTRGKIVDIIATPPLLQPKSTFREYSPVIEFEHNGDKVIFQSHNRSKECSYEVGDEVNVRYLKRNNRIAEIDGVELETDVPAKEMIRHFSIGIAVIVSAIIL